MIKILKGDIIHTEVPDHFSLYADSYIIAENHKVVGIFKDIPDIYKGYLVEDYTGFLIIPAFIDLHLHAPQYMQMGIGLNLELIDWLDQYTFMLEGRFSDINYAKKVYPHFVEALYDAGTLRSCIYGTIHDESNRYLAQCLEAKKLNAYLGKVNMDRNAPESLIQTVEESVDETKRFIEDYKNNSYVKPIITPRFAPSCSTELLESLGDLSVSENIPVQSHLGENRSEIQWVKELFVEADHYTDVYKKRQLLGPEKALMAHCVYMEPEELNMIKENPVYIVHCPNSNMNLTSGIMPLTRYLDMGLTVGLGSDIGAGHTLSMQQTITAAIQCSKIRHTIYPEERVLSESEAFYLATNVNGSFFGNVGSFSEGNMLDCLVIKDEHPLMDALTPIEQLQRFLYCGTKDSIHARYLNGHLI